MAKPKTENNDASVDKSCLYIKKFQDVHLPTLKKLIKKAYKSPAIAGAIID
jgi:hypothetical protein